MQRSSTRVTVDVTFTYNRGTTESGTHTYENISTPEEFALNYRELCNDKQVLIDRKSTCIPAPYYSITLSGTMSGKPFEKTFSNLDDYHFFLIRHKLWAEPPSNRHKII